MVTLILFFFLLKQSSIYIKIPRSAPRQYSEWIENPQNPT